MTIPGSRFTAGCAFGLVLASFAVPATSDTFTLNKKWTPVGPNPCDIVATDLNGDGLTDLVTADRGQMTDPSEERPANDELSVLVATPGLTFVRQPPLRTGFGPYCIVVANMDDLKAPDLVVGSFHATRGRNLSLFCNVGDNLFNPTYFEASRPELALWITAYLHQELFDPKSFAAPDDLLPYERVRDSDAAAVFTKPGITALTIADFNHDGYRDVVATGWSSDVLILFPGDPSTYLREPKYIRAEGGPRDIKAADFDKDGQLDLVTTMYATGQIALWKGLADGGFEPVTRFYSTGDLPHRVEVGDINADGAPDLVVSHCYADDSIAIFYGDGGFSFSTSQEIVLGEDRRIIEHEIRDIALDDFDGNKRLDIAAACYASSKVAVFINASQDSSLPQKFTRETYTFTDARPRALCAADMNQDGSKDLAVALWQANAVGLLLGKAPKE